jgi:RNA polymerase sigma factor (sigma-70 family)
MLSFCLMDRLIKQDGPAYTRGETPMKSLWPQARRQGVRTKHLQEFEMLYAESFRGVYGYIAARVQNVQTAEDLTSETFLRAWRRWPPREVTGGVPRAWVFQIARNLVIDHYRASSRRPTVPLDEANTYNPREIPGEDGHLKAITLQMAMATLSPRDQDVLSLRLAGLTNRELGSVLELSEAAAGMACLRALRRLREKLEE